MMTRASLFAVAVLLLYGSPAHALTHVAPPGNSGASQYQEDVPSAAGAVPVTKLPSAVNAGQAVPHSVVTQLDHDGAAGHAAAQLANRTAPTATSVHASHSGTNAPATSSGGPPSGGSPPRGGSPSGGESPSSPGSQITGAVIGGTGGGLGLLLPVALAGFLIVAIAIVLARRRRAR